MLYLSSGYQNNKMRAVSVDGEEFEKLFNHPIVKTDLADYGARQGFKRRSLPYFLAGNIKESIRKNENVINKRLVAIDYDDINVSEQAFVQAISQKLDGYAFMLYPTINCYHKVLANGEIDERPRYRLVINTDAPHDPKDNEHVISIVGAGLGFPYDESSLKLSQLMSVPVITPFTNESMIIKSKGKPLSIDEILKKKKPPESKRLSSASNKCEAPYRGHSYKNTLSRFVETLAEGVDEGNRNNWLTSQIGKMVYYQADLTAVYNMAHIINEGCIRPPLSDQEVNRIFKSVLRMEGQKRQEEVEND